MMLQCSLKQKMVIPLLASVIVSGLIGLPFIVQKLSLLKTEFVETLITGKQNEIARAIEAAGQEALKQASLFSQTPEVIEAFVLAHTGNIDDENDDAGQQAREKLRRELQPTVAGYEKVMGRKISLHFHLPNGRSLVRLWREKQTQKNGKWVDVSDDISSFRKTVLDVNRTGAPVKGIELGRGGFVVRGLVPVKSPSGNQLGSAEILTDFNPIFQSSAGKGQKILLYMNADQLPVTKKLQDPQKYPALDDRYVLVSGTKEGSVEKIVTPSLLDQGRSELAIKREDSYAISVFPVNDYQGRQIGVMAFYLDIANVHAGIRSVLMILGLVSGAILLLIIGVNYAALMKTVVTPVNAIAGELKLNADQVTASAGQVASSSQNLAEGAGETAAAIEQTSASLEEIAAMTRQNADNSSQADALMEETVQHVSQVNREMELLTRAMAEISKSSEETFTIVKNIDNIAFQTNLLALNAAVEAARAGDAGAGFAVVADEVRTLAMRAAESAKDTATLIEGIGAKVKGGTEIVVSTGKSFERVAGTSEKSMTLIKEIAQASREQAKGLDQITKAISEMDSVTQQNAALAEEVASAAEELNAMAELLDGLAGSLSGLVCGEIPPTGASGKGKRSLLAITGR